MSDAVPATSDTSASPPRRNGRRTGRLDSLPMGEPTDVMKQETDRFPCVSPPARQLEGSHGSSIAHHGEILQGIFETPDGQLQRALVTLPCRLLHSFAAFRPGAGALSVAPAWRVKALEAARLTLAHLGVPEQGGVLTITANVPVGWGLGSSTSDVIATIRAVAKAFNRQLAPEALASLAVRAEVASDSTMFEDRAVLFAHRDGNLLEDFSRALPSLEVLGFNVADGVDTVGMQPAAYTLSEIEAFRPLLGLLRRALYTQDASLVGLVASASARINQRHLPKPYFDRLEALVDDLGAAGLQVAHSGSVVGLLFDMADPLRDERIAAGSAKLAELGCRSVWRFSTRRTDPPAAPHEGLDF
jgi:uncharacterized protein involved in propanediol utilization